MDRTPLLSVIVPVYNAEEYVEICIKSICAQGFQDGELEILCVDDGSSDGSLNILKNLARSDTRIRVFYQKNAGVSSARNLGLSYARGKYFEFVDADDELVPFSMRQVCTQLDANGCAVAQFDIADGHASANCRELKCKVGKMTLSGAVWRYLFLREKYGGFRFDTEMKYAEDTLFAQTVLLTNPKCLIVNQGLYIYRDNPESVMRKRDFYVVADCMLKLAFHHDAFMKERRFPGEEKRMETWRSRATAAHILYRLRAGDKTTPFADLKRRGLWPYKNEWKLLIPHLTSKAEIRRTFSNYSLFLVRYRPIWQLFKATNLFYNR